MEAVLVAAGAVALASIWCSSAKVGEAVLEVRYSVVMLSLLGTKFGGASDNGGSRMDCLHQLL